LSKASIENVCSGSSADAAAQAIAAAVTPHPADAEWAPHIVLVDDVDVGCRALAGSARSSRSRALAVWIPAASIPRRMAWRLLSAGASDVVRFSDCGTDGVATRIERWACVDEIVASPLVRENLVGESATWLATLRELVEVAAFTDTPVVLLGESGTGKELAARLIHTLDRRAGKRDLVVVDCGTLAPELAGSELFGHERGAYTGAIGAREGAFAAAERGTVFLDEIGDLPQTLQLQLLRAVQERTYKPVGSNLWRKSEFRLISATNRELEADTRVGRFRLDLYHRLTASTVRLPPLRQRTSDILPLARSFLREACPRDPPPLDPAVEEWLVQREYPGNVRELRQVAFRLARRHVGRGPITPGDVAPEDRPPDAAPFDWRDAAFEQSISRAISYGATLKEIGRAATDAAVRIVLDLERGNLLHASQKLGVTKRALEMRRGPVRATRREGAS
jgi:transcriptional regulator with GAF, ATPase, and Fis domain